MAVSGRGDTLSSQLDAQADLVSLRESNDMENCMKPAMNFNDNDAICMRTRARYSLASFTLDELETFLQETDDDDGSQNVDDQEEYRKFLAAVLHGGDGNGQMVNECENVDDEDEDNDADFQLEIEEALESDLDVNTGIETAGEYETAGRRPVTRQNKRQKAASQKQKTGLEQWKRPLRPLLPFLPGAPIASVPAPEGNNLTSEAAPHYHPSTARDDLPNPFTADQIGHLHCLIHEHVQLLIQVFSLCVLDPSRQHVALQIQELLSEMVHQRDQVLIWKSIPYPSTCFDPPFIHPSVPVESSKMCTAQFSSESPPPSFNLQGCPSVSANLSPYGVIDERNSNGQLNSFRTVDSTFWAPHANDPILSVLDVAPLNLVGRFMENVSSVKQECRRHHLEGSFGSRLKREPLFASWKLPPLSENTDCVRVPISPTPETGVYSPSSCQPPKKTMAATLVENTKKQSVALAPKEIVKLAQQFFPLFNPALYPHNPPPSSVAKRVLFTDSEDELLALGLMECNTDWKAIQQRFLPCKTKHQIFVRQKNRCSSKASENPIKSVRRLKTSPLNAEEVELIHEGLQIFRLDWISIWKFIVPYRDPSLLPRQWRIATGTQKSYKNDTATNERRRLYVFNKRCRAAAWPHCQAASEKEDNTIENYGGEACSGDDCVDNGDGAYVHEAFLADWRPNGTGLVSSVSSFSNYRKKNQPSFVLSEENTCPMGEMSMNRSTESQPQNGQMPDFLAAPSTAKMRTLNPLSYNGCSASHASGPNYLGSKFSSKLSSPPLFYRPYRSRRRKHVQLVKLAPDLPPVNLPRSVRVISQSAFKSCHSGSPTKTPGGMSDVAETQSVVQRHSDGAESGNNHSIDARLGRDRLSPELKGKFSGEERGSDPYLRMHPLLFKAPGDVCLSSYHPIYCGSGAPIFSSSPGNQHQLILSLFRGSQQVNSTVNHSDKPSKPKNSASASSGIDFHPLMRRTDDVMIGAPANECLPSPGSVDMDTLQDGSADIGYPSDTVPIQPQTDAGLQASSDKADVKASELDLEIHLSSINTSTKEKVLENRNVDQHNENGLSESAPEATIEIQGNGENCPVPSVLNTISGESGACVSAVSVPRNTICEYNDQSLPGIVMEQEELSDSDEEVGEHVEFECEEMLDSEGEEVSD